MKSIIAIALLAISASTASAVELYSCTISPADDGFFTNIYLKVDGEKITGQTVINNQPADIGDDVYAYTYTSVSHAEYIVIGYQEGRELTEDISFVLTYVVNKAGSAERSTTREGFGQTTWPVSMTCEIATPL